MRRHPRERRLALGAALLIGCWGLVSWVAQPLWERTQALRLHAAAQQEKLVALRRLIAQAPTIEHDQQLLAAYLQPAASESGEGSLLSELEALSRTADIQLNLKPRPAKREGHTSRREVELDLEGGQTGLLSFLDAVLRLPELVAIDRLRISPSPSREGLLRANLVIQKFSLQ